MKLELGEICSCDPADFNDAGSRRQIGLSREGRPLHASTLGSGPLKLSLVAGAHADEPVGPLTLAQLEKWLATAPAAAPLLEKATFNICADINPDGRERNSAWAETSPWSLREYLRNRVRERPGDDIEFGYPAEGGRPARPENIAVAEFLRDGGPFDFHASLHGMAIAEGAWYLVNRRDPADTTALREDLGAFTGSCGLGFHDWDRKGEKGFFRIAPGFCTTPTSTAMKAHFENLQDPQEAEKFLPSSMEYIASLGGDPLCMVSEIPLFLVTATAASSPTPGANFIEVLERLPGAIVGFESGREDELKALEETFSLQPVSPQLAMKLQLGMILLASGLAELEELL